MRKTLIISFLLIAALSQCQKPPAPRACPFCDEEKLRRQTVYEDSLSIVLYSYKAMMKGHVLIIPKRHVERFEELTEEEVLSIQKLINKTQMAAQKALRKRSYLLLQKNGKEVGQTVPHLHFHFLPKKEDGSTALDLLAGFFWNSFRPPMEEREMMEIIDELKGYY